jgi:hypothetical protein
MVIAKRLMQFCAGPEQMVFYACEEHLLELVRGDVSCFLKLKGETIQPVADPDEDECFFCKEP